MRFMIYHTREPGTGLDDIKAFAKKLVTNQEVRPLRSLFCLSENKAVCIWESPDRPRLVDWLKENEVPYDSIYEVEMQGEAGQFTVLHEPSETHSP